MKRNVVMKNFKLTNEEWARYSGLRLSMWDAGSFSAVVRKGLALLFALSEEDQARPGIFRVNEFAYTTARGLVDSMRIKAKSDAELLSSTAPAESAAVKSKTAGRPKVRPPVQPASSTRAARKKEGASNGNP